MNIALSGIVAALVAVSSLTPPARLAPSSLSVTTTTAAGSIVRAQFTSGVKDRVPTDSLATAGTDKTQIYFFTELKGLSGGKVTHRWEHGGKVVREQTFEVRDDRWRVWSNKGMDPHATGEWKVTVVDGSGATLGSYTLTYGK